LLGLGAERMRELWAAIDSVKAPTVDKLPGRNVTESLQL